VFDWADYAKGPLLRLGQIRESCEVGLYYEKGFTFSNLMNFS
jgi:hypothetical protein